MALQRVQMLLEPLQHRRLAELARAKGMSISQVTRLAIDAGLELMSENERQAGLKQALEAARQLRESLPVIEVDVVADIRRMREDRDGQLLGRD